MSELIVTICCITYNHEAFIRDCLEGFVMQQTNFRFEAIVHDDASTDGTAAIVAEYAAKYPEIIKPLYETENQWSKRDGSIRRIMNAHMHGKYIAMCEGDDYWTDPHKLQKQVDFLEANPDFSMCFHKVEVISDDDNMARNIFDHVVSKEYTGSEVIERWTVSTCSIVYRREIRQLIPIHKYLKYGDNVLFLTCARHGRLMCIDKKMSSYRRHQGGAVALRLTDTTHLTHFMGLWDIFPEFRDAIYIVIRRIATRMVKREKNKRRKFKAILPYSIKLCRRIGFSKFLKILRS